MSIASQVRAWFAANPDTRINNAGLRAAIDIDDGQQVSVALNAAFAAGAVKREKKPDGAGYEYWMPSSGAKPSPAPLPAKEIAARLTAERSANKPRTASTPGPKPGQKNKKPRLAKKAKTVRAKTGKRKYTHRAAPPQSGSAPVAQDPRPAGTRRASDFAINEDGDLGISAGQNKIALQRAEVQRLQGFLKTTAPLWQ